jgi:hypothetical protein
MYSRTRPTAARLSNVAVPYRPVSGRPLLELPVPSFSRLSLPFHPSYALVIGDWYFRQGVRECRSTGEPFVLLFHLTDFADPLPEARRAGWKQRLFTLSTMSAARKRARCSAMLDIITSQFSVRTTTDLIAGYADTSPGSPAR